MEIVYAEKVIDDIIYWKKKRNDKIQIRISELVDSIEMNRETRISQISIEWKMVKKH